eukprot:RCo041211
MLPFCTMDRFEGNRSPAVARLRSFIANSPPDKLPGSSCRVQLTAADCLQVDLDGVHLLTVGLGGTRCEQSSDGGGADFDCAMISCPLRGMECPLSKDSSEDSEGSGLSRESWSPPDEFPAPHCLGGTLRWSEISVGKMLGLGGYSQVFVAEHVPTGHRYALKVLRLDNGTRSEVLQQELRHVVAWPKHRNIVSATEAFYHDRELKILMELMDMGSLSRAVRKLGPLPEAVVAAIALQVLDGLSTLHAHGIIHRDVKPSNLLLSSRGEVKISDFGVSAMLSQGRLREVQATGSHCYFSPERLQAHEYDTTSDIWSFGLSIAEALLGVFPFIAEDGNVAGKRCSG